MKKQLALVLAVVAVVSLGGCAGVLNSASVSDAAVQLSDEKEPYLVFNYSIEEERSAVIETPGGTTIAERRISPTESISALSFPTHQPGTYTLAIRSEGETVTEEKIEFDGPDPEIVSVSPIWSQNALQSIVVEIENRGDLPTPIESASVAARGQGVSLDPAYEWLEPNETTEVNISTSYQSSISITEPGDVRGDVVVETGNSTLNAVFQETFEGPNIQIADVNDIWDANNLESVEIRLENTGDMATEVNSSIRRGGETLEFSGPTLVSAGGYATVEISDFRPMLSIDSPRTVSMEIVADSKYGYQTATAEKEIEPAAVELLSISPNWDGDVLNSVDVKAKNSGDLESEVPATVTANGDEVFEGTVRIEGDSTETGLLAPLLGSIGTLVGDGNMTVTVTLEGDQGNGTASSTKEFGERDGEIRDIDPTFTSNYGENTSSLSSVSFTVRNTGDLPLRYDDVRFQIDGVTGSDAPYSDEVIEIGGSKSVRSYPYISVSDGTHELTIQLLNEGNVVVEKTTTVSTA